MTLNKAILHVSADVDGDGVDESGEFHMQGGLEVVPSMEPNFPVDGRGGTINSVTSSSVGDGEPTNGGFYLDLGGGPFMVELQFEGWEGSDLQWGNTGNADEPTKSDATGAAAITQLEVLMQYLLVGQIDSRSPATLEYGEHHSGGLYDPLDVVVVGPQMRRASGGGGTFTGSMTCIRAAAFDKPVDAEQRQGWF